MTLRTIEEIEEEIKKVDERIHSKKDLLKQYPNDTVLQLSLMDFEDLKEDLIRELAEVEKKPKIYTEYIRSRLKKIQEELTEARYLEITNFENSEIQDEIDYLKLIETGLIKELEFCYLESGYSIYEMRLKGEGIDDHMVPIAQLGEILVNIQEVPDSISEIIYFKEKNYIKPFEEKETIQSDFDGELKEKEEKTNRKSKSPTKGILSEQLVANTQFYTPGIIEGSIRVILTSAQPMLDNSLLNNTLTIFKELVECGDNKEAIREQIKILGDNKPISKYQKLLNSLYKNKIDIEFSGKTKELTDFNIFKLDNKQSEKIYKVLNKNDDPIEKPITKIGKFRALDLENHTFKFHVDIDDKLIPGSFKKELESKLEDVTFNETFKIELLSIIPIGEFNKNKNIKYKLLELN